MTTRRPIPTQRRRPPHHEKRKKRTLTSSISVSSATHVAAGIVGSAGLLLAAQALYVAISTPRLPPPANSGHDFEEDGLIANFYHDTTSTRSNDDDDWEEATKDTFNLVLLGDSPVEGIGNDTHCAAMGGKTALAFSEALGRGRSVRYWSYGKSGLTAKGIQLEMIPLLERTVNKYRIDAIIVSCGVNNVLSGHSATTFGTEVDALLSAVEECCRSSTSTVHHDDTKIIMLQLIDFEYLPFLPWPLSKYFSWRSRQLQKEMERLVDGRNCQEQKSCHNMHIDIASFPDIRTLLSDTSHPLLDYMTEEKKNALTLSDFYSDDNFHPASHGNTILGKILSKKYKDMMNKV